MSDWLEKIKEAAQISWDWMCDAVTPDEAPQELSRLDRYEQVPIENIPFAVKGVNPEILHPLYPAPIIGSAAPNLNPSAPTGIPVRGAPSAPGPAAVVALLIIGGAVLANKYFSSPDPAKPPPDPRQDPEWVRNTLTKTLKKKNITDYTNRALSKLKTNGHEVGHVLSHDEDANLVLASLGYISSRSFYEQKNSFEAILSLFEMAGMTEQADLLTLWIPFVSPQFQIPADTELIGTEPEVPVLIPTKNPDDLATAFQKDKKAEEVLQAIGTLDPETYAKWTETAHTPSAQDFLIKLWQRALIDANGDMELARELFLAGLTQYRFWHGTETFKPPMNDSSPRLSYDGGTMAVAHGLTSSPISEEEKPVPTTRSETNSAPARYIYNTPITSDIVVEISRPVLSPLLTDGGSPIIRTIDELAELLSSEVEIVTQSTTRLNVSEFLKKAKQNPDKIYVINNAIPEGYTEEALEALAEDLPPDTNVRIYIEEATPRTAGGSEEVLSPEEIQANEELARANPHPAAQELVDLADTSLTKEGPLKKYVVYRPVGSDGPHSIEVFHTGHQHYQHLPDGMEMVAAGHVQAQWSRDGRVSVLLTNQSEGFPCNETRIGQNPTYTNRERKPIARTNAGIIMGANIFRTILGSSFNVDYICLQTSSRIEDTPPPPTPAP